MKGCSIGLLGPPGTGKTAIAKTLSKCLDFPFEQISFGGVSDPEFLTGHDYTYIGSRPGEIVRCLSRMGYKNGIIFLDEFEKTSGKKGISSTLLHLTDFTQNHEFRDNYLADITIDLSNIWFIYSMNSLPDDTALRDRIFTINVEGYNIKDKIQIVQNYLLPRAVKNIGRKDKDITITEESALYLINKIDKGNENKGVRNLEKTIKDIVNKIHFLVSNKKDRILQVGFNITFDVKIINEYPVQIGKESIDKFVEDTNKDEVYLNMFL
jgi:ATP-dependent Lon protease